MELAIAYSGPVLGLVALGVALYSLYHSSRSTPSKMIHRVNNLNEAVEFVTAEMEKHSIRVSGWKGELETDLDNVETVLSQVERKRKSIAASESRMNGTPVAAPVEVNPAQLTSQELERYARARGLMSVG